MRFLRRRLIPSEMLQEADRVEPVDGVAAARSFEREGKFRDAVGEWATVLAQTSATDEAYWSHFVEWQFAIREVRRTRGETASQLAPSVPNATDRFQEFLLATRREVTKPQLRFDRAAVFKAIDLLTDVGAVDAVRVLVNLLSWPKADRELMTKIAGILYGDVLPASHDWLMQTDFSYEKWLLFNQVLKHWLSGNAFDPLVVALKELEVRLALTDLEPSPEVIWGTIDSVRQQTWTPTDDCERELRPDEMRVPVPSKELNVAITLAFQAPMVVYDLQRKLSPRKLFAVLGQLAGVSPIYHVITSLGYPMGGGESFMHQTCRLLSELGFHCVWTSFAEKNGRPNRVASRVRTPYYHDVRIAGGATTESILAALRDAGGWIVHSQGAMNEAIAEIASDIRVPVLLGYHFWSGLVQLGASGNRHILKNIEQHELLRPKRREAPNARRYVVSEFMNDVVGAAGGSPYDVIHSMPDPAHYMVERPSIGTKVTQINIAPGKGGEIFLACVRALGHQIPFAAVQTEPSSEDKDVEIRSAIEKSPGSIYKTFGEVKEIYQNARLMMVPSLVDETFCRVAFEAAMNGVPVLCTRNGYLPYMFGDAGVYLSENPQEWIDAIADLYADEERIKDLGSRQRRHLIDKFAHGSAAFLDVIRRMLGESTQRNIGLFGPWSNQGLGYQLKTYSRVLRRAGYKVHVFSYQPYSLRNKGLIETENSSDWTVPEGADSIYHSFNDRENVTANEIEQFVKANNIGPLLMPEVCWKPSWDRLRQISVRGLFTFGVPNIETVRSSEVAEHANLHATLFNSRVCQQVLYAMGVRNGRYIGHGFGEALDERQLEDKISRMRSRERIRYLHIGGHNPVSRKQTPLVLKAFIEALKDRADIELVATVMKGHGQPGWANLHPNISIVSETLSHADILQWYRDCDVSIQVSSHEGLGLGFFESISVGTPVISLDVAPHNEVVLKEGCGWLIEASPVALKDNDDPVSFGAEFDVSELAAVVAELNSDDIGVMMRRAAAAHGRNFDESALLVRLLKALSH